MSPLAKRKSYSATKPSLLRSAAHAPAGLAKPAIKKHTTSWLKKALTRLVSNDVFDLFDIRFLFPTGANLPWLLL
jgi:hypothetical protein